MIDSRRVQKYERDLKRWEYMEDEQDRQDQRINAMKSKYQIGNANKGGAAFNILNLEYEKSKEGQYLAQKDHDAKVRNHMRSKNIDSLSNNKYNLVNGNNRVEAGMPIREG